MARIDKHYERLNLSVLKPLTEIRLENTPKNPEKQRNICDEYRFKVSLPTSPLYQAAIAHLKLSNPTVGENLEMLPRTLRKYNEEVDSTESVILVQLDKALRQRELQYTDIPQSFFNILTILSSLWKRQFIEHLNEPLGRFMSHDRLLEELKTWTRENDGTKMRLGIHTVWQESKAGEKDKVVEAINSAAVDGIILNKLDLLETSRLDLATKVSEIVRHISAISVAIEEYSYDERADCCYTNVPWLIRHIV